MYVCVEVYMHRLEVDMWIFVYVEVNVHRWGRLHTWTYVCVEVYMHRKGWVTHVDVCVCGGVCAGLCVESRCQQWG